MRIWKASIYSYEKIQPESNQKDSFRQNKKAKNVQWLPNEIRRNKVISGYSATPTFVEYRVSTQSLCYFVSSPTFIDSETVFNSLYHHTWCCANGSSSETSKKLDTNIHYNWESNPGQQDWEVDTIIYLENFDFILKL